MKKPIINGIVIHDKDSLIDAISEYYEYDNEILDEICVFDDYATAVIGISEDHKIVYSYEKMIEFLIERDDMTYEEAIEFVDYNAIRTLPYMKKPPIILYEIEGYKD